MLNALQGKEENVVDCARDKPSSDRPSRAMSILIEPEVTGNFVSAGFITNNLTCGKTQKFEHSYSQTPCHQYIYMCYARNSLLNVSHLSLNVFSRGKIEGMEDCFAI